MVPVKMLQEIIQHVNRSLVLNAGGKALPIGQKI